MNKLASPEIFLDGRVVLHAGDCRDVIKTLADNSIDHTISDPPYEAHMHAAKRGEKKYGSRERIRIDGHANPPPVDFASIDGMRGVLVPEIARITRSWCLLFCTPEGIAPWRDAIEAAGLRYKRACFWVKPDSAPQFNGQGPAFAVEPFVTAWAGAGISAWNGGGKRNFYIVPTNNAERSGLHPTEKPLDLMRQIIADFTQPDDTVFDPFMGSGTTAVACIELGRRFIGCENLPHYFQAASARVCAAALNFSAREKRDSFARFKPASPLPLFHEAAP